MRTPSLYRKCSLILGLLLLTIQLSSAGLFAQTIEDIEKVYEEGEYEKTIELATKLLETDPKNHEALFLRATSRVEVGVSSGNAQMLRDGVADARSSIENSQAKSPEYYLPYLYGMTNLSLLEERDEHAKTSITVATQIIDGLEMSEADKANILYQRALAKLQVSENIEEAITDFKAAIALQPRHMASLTAIADAYAMNDQDDEALAAYGKFIEAHPEHPIGYNNRGMFHKQLGNQEEALADFQKAVDLEPKFFVAQINLGYTQMESGQASVAEKSFTNALALQPENASVYGLRANARLRQGNSEGAIADYKKSIELFPRNPLAYADLGFAYFFLKQYQEAFKQFDQAINLNGRLRFLDPWIYASMVLSGQVQDANNRFAGTLAKPDGERDWIDLLTLYLMGKVDEKTLLARVNPEDEAAATAQSCEGHYFVGLRQSNLAGKEAAATHFKECLKTEASHLSAYRAAQFELQQFSK